MSDDLFSRAQYTPEPGTPVPEYSRANTSDPAFPRALLYGVGGAILGSVLYAAFTAITHFQIGIMAIGVGYLVGKAMMAGPTHRGGREYQVTAGILTYLAVSSAAVLEALWSSNSLDHLGLAGYALLAILSPFLELTSNVFSGLIGLVILFVGIRAAVRLTSAREESAEHPFTTS